MSAEPVHLASHLIPGSLEIGIEKSLFIRCLGGIDQTGRGDDIDDIRRCGIARDVIGNAAIKAAVAPIGIATGEHCHKQLMFKQFMQAGALDFCQLDTGRLGSVNEIIAVLLLATKFGVPVCPHAGGVGLCEMVQHISMLDFVSVSGSRQGRVTEYIDHLHEHFTDPCTVAEAAYLLPTKPGYSTQMHPASIAAFRFPNGTYWAARTQAEHTNPGASGHFALAEPA